MGRPRIYMRGRPSIPCLVIMISLRDILLGIGLPAIIAVVVLLVVALPWRKAAKWRVALSWGLGVGAGLVAGFLAVIGTPGAPWVPEDWLLVAVMPAAIVVGVLAWAKLPTAVAWLLRAIVSGGVPVLLCQSYLKQVGGDFAPWTAGEAAAWMVGWAVVIFIVWTALALRVQPGRAVPIAMMFVAGCTGMVVLMSDSQSIGQIGLALGAAMFGGVLASTLLPRDKAAVGGVDVAWLVTAGLLILGRHYAEYEPTHAKWALLAGAPLLVWVAALPVVRRWPGWLAGSTSVVAVLIPTLIAVGIASAKFYREMSDAGYM